MDGKTTNIWRVRRRRAEDALETSLQRKAIMKDLAEQFTNALKKKGIRQFGEASAMELVDKLHAFSTKQDYAVWKDLSESTNDPEYVAYKRRLRKQNRR